MEERLQRHSGTGRPDPLAPESDTQDPVARWAEELRGAAVADLDPGQVTQMASLASSAAAVGAASLATATGLTAGAVTGGKTMTALFASTMAKFVAAGALVATLGGGAAVTGNLPAGMQNGAADFAANIGIELPRAEVAIALDGAGELVLNVVDGALEVIEMDAGTGWTAEVRSQSSGELVVDFVSETGTKTVTAVQDAAGKISSEISSSNRADARGEAQLENGTEAQTNVESTSEADLELPLTGTNGSVETKVEVEGEIRIGLNN